MSVFHQIFHNLGFRVFIYALILSLILPMSIGRGKTKRETYFANTQYQLDVFRIYGREPGNTLLIFGGIQDEPGGYLAADLYADMSLARGNLIVVPRANFNTIIHGVRGVNGDMNRKFDRTGEPKDYDDKIVAILKKLIAESDYFFNLHGGSGFYRDTHIDAMHNPMRFGQSIIADASEYYSPRIGRTIQLKEIALRVTREVNKKIKNPHYHFHFNNHRTSDPKSQHKEQRKSATYFALTHEGIAAFGLEVSKQLPSIDMKVRHMIWLINEFFKEFDIVPEFPSAYLKPPELQFLVASINDGDAAVISNKSDIVLHRGDQLEIRYIQANYDRGLSVDILGYGTVQDLRSKIKIYHDTKIIVRKDKYTCGHVWVHVRGASTETGKSIAAKAEIEKEEEYLSLTVNDNKQLVIPEDTIRVIRGDRIRILNISPALEALGLVNVNFYGYVPPNKSGEDRGCEINTGTDLSRRYSLNGKGFLYGIIIQQDNKTLRRFLLRIIEPEFHYLVLMQDGHRKLWVQNNETIVVKPKTRIEIVDVKTNIPPEYQEDIKVNFKGFYGRGDGEDRQMIINIEKDLLKRFSTDGKGNNYEILVSRLRDTFGRVNLKIRDDSTNISLLEEKGAKGQRHRGTK